MVTYHPPNVEGGNVRLTLAHCDQLFMENTIIYFHLVLLFYGWFTRKIEVIMRSFFI